MANKQTLTAKASFGYGGKQFIARITGRDPKYTFARTFLGKRDEFTQVVVDEPGIYEIRDIDKKGNADTSFTILWLDGDTLRAWPLDEDEAMTYAKRLDREDATTLAKEDIIKITRERIAEGETKDPAEMIQLVKATADILGLSLTEKHLRSVVLDARRALVRRLDTTQAEEVMLELADVKTELLVEEVRKRGFRVVAILTPRGPRKPKPKAEEMESVEEPNTGVSQGV